MAKPIAALAPPARLLCGPGPTNVEPAALAAMGKPMLGHLDPDFHAILDEVVAMLAQVYRAHDAIVLPLQSTGTSGMETGIVNLSSPATRWSWECQATSARASRRSRGATARTWSRWPRSGGRHGPKRAARRRARAQPRARLVAVVQERPPRRGASLAELGEAVRGTGALLMADCVTTLGGVRIDFDAWGWTTPTRDPEVPRRAAGMSPLALSPRALDRIETRTRPVPFSLDLRLLRLLLRGRPAAYHHTAPILPCTRCTRSCARRSRRASSSAAAPRAAGRRFAARAEEAGLEVLAEPGHRLAPLTAVRVPDGIEGKDVQRQLLAERGLEVGGGLGAATPPIWRIGLMGPNASEETADEVLGALTAVLADGRVPVAG